MVSHHAHLHPGDPQRAIRQGNPVPLRAHRLTADALQAIAALTLDSDLRDPR